MTKSKNTTPVIIDVAINGIRTQAMNPNIPVGPDAIAAEAIRCLDAGAAIIHTHNRDYLLTDKDAADDYLLTWRQVLAQRPEALWYPTLVHEPDPKKSGVEHVEHLVREVGLKIGCIDPGSVNLGSHLQDGVPAGVLHVASPNRIRQQFARYRDWGVGSALGIYEPGFLRTALAYEKAGWVTPGSTINLYFLGDYGLLAQQPASTCGLPPDPRYLDVYLSLMEGSRLPWFVSVWGGGYAESKPLIEHALDLGGHIQVGLELHYHPTEKPTNLALLEEAIALAEAAGRPVATTAQAAEILGL